MTDQKHLTQSSDNLSPNTIHLSDMPEHIPDRHFEAKEVPKEGIEVSSSVQVLPSICVQALVHPTTSSSLPTEAIDLTTSQAPSQSRIQTATIMACLMAAVFVAALDVTIIVTALPTISRQFSSDTAYTWVGTAYVLTYNTSSPLWGSLSDIFGRKPVLLSGIAIFFIGSLMCGAAPSLSILLAGRAVQGLGGAGCIVLVNICVSDLFSLRDRGFYFGLIGVMWALASGIGPVIGGVFTQSLSWRYCFWLNLPITGLVFVLLLFTLRLPNPQTPILEGLATIDWVGAILISAFSVMILLGLNFGGSTYPWSSATVICLIIFGASTFGIFIFHSAKLTKSPIIPLHKFTSASAISSLCLCFTHGIVFMGVSYYLPLYFQTVLATSPLKSGIYMLPFIITMTITSGLTGLYIMKTGHYIPAVYLGIILTPLGIGLFITFPPATNWIKLIIFQIIGAVGLGLNFEGPLLALQAVVGNKDVAMATATFGFVRSMSNAFSIVIGGVVFANVMARQRPQLGRVLGDDIAEQLAGDAAANIGVIDGLSESEKVVVKMALLKAVKAMWILYTAFAGTSVIAGLGMKAHVLSKDNEGSQVGLANRGRQREQVDPGAQGAGAGQ
ncbi:MFS general substrate transporter [Glarea lozoyensis ATCC 20868]|uniref:MFS general substrate transporter n=1 Tax=Glarea lozoyensis (strain ATCC 20868 / MF5171) TaxID=1116229 RepID=S3D6X8_GLAL2|nr:MFS general substrate transporter [Glarea lozoyensis ATCC 20868]EPE33550.1 MFS general substrate transporter [Glarea lozoyensis ATCC 20868]